MKIILLFFIAFTCQAANLQDYFPSNRTSYYADSSGTVTTRYEFKYTKGFDDWEIDKKGRMYTWKKSFLLGNRFVTKTIQPLLFGRDQSVIELGGKKKGQQVTYSNNGLYWSGKGGLSTNFYTRQTNVLVNGEVIGRAYSHSALVEQLPVYTLEGGNRKTYNDVIHIIMYHGTDNSEPVRCWDKPQVGEGVYSPFKGYNSYAMELWMARGIGIIKQVIPYIEDGRTRWDMPNCTGNLFSGGESYTIYLAN
jgi:hypothetical protein